MFEHKMQQLLTPERLMNLKKAYANQEGEERPLSLISLSKSDLKQIGGTEQLEGLLGIGNKGSMFIPGLHK